MRSFRNAEVILTFAADFLIDYLQKERPNRTLKSIPELDLDLLASKIDKADPRWRLLIQLELHSEIQRLAAARFYTPFFIHSQDSHRDLWLVHLSRHHRARDVMMGVHWELQNSFAHYGRPGLKMLGYRPDEDVFVTNQPCFSGFFFDDKAKALSHGALLEELPAAIFSEPQPIPFSELFSKISNETPATSELLRRCLSELAKEKTVVIKDRTGSTVRKSGIQHDSDLIILPRQKRLFL
jgi:hypothetical protein